MLNMPGTPCSKTALRVQGGRAEQNFEIFRILSLNCHSSTNFYWIHQPFMWGMFHMYNYLSCYSSARAHKFKLKDFFRKISNA